LWVYGRHWVVETANATVERQADLVLTSAVGDVVLDGQSLNAEKGYDESFGFQTPGGKPLFFSRGTAR
jgi:hypothetical protein